MNASPLQLASPWSLRKQERLLILAATSQPQVDHAPQGDHVDLSAKTAKEQYRTNINRKGTVELSMEYKERRFQGKYISWEKPSLKPL